MASSTRTSSLRGSTTTRRTSKRRTPVSFAAAAFVVTFRRLVDGEHGCLPAAVILLIKACLWIYANWDPEASWFQIVVLAAVTLRYLVTGSWD